MDGSPSRLDRFLALATPLVRFLPPLVTPEEALEEAVERMAPILARG